LCDSAREDGAKTSGIERGYDRRSALLVSITGAGALFSCDLRARADDVDFTRLTSMQLAAMLLHKHFFFVNVHTPYEGEIKNTDAFIVYDKISENLNKLPRDKNAEIVLYCRSGRMSEITARELTKLGYTRVSHLSGGMNDWKKNGFELIEK
jgi:rhodanese-related sulfurtransferase